MFDLWKSLIALHLLFICGICASTACDADPGISHVADGMVSDQKPGSVLLYSFYTSGIISPDSQNTQFTVTNTHPNQVVAVRFYFVLDVSGTFSLGNFGETPICLAPNQTASFH